MAPRKGAMRVEWGLSTGRVGGCWHGVGREQGEVGNSRAEWMVGWEEEGRCDKDRREWAGYSVNSQVG